MSIRLSVDSVQDPNTLVQALAAATRNIPEIHWYPTIFVTGSAPQSIYHKLGVVPSYMVVDALADANVWATPVDRKEWGPERVVVRCSASGATMNIGLIV